MSNLNDVISGATLYNGHGFSYVADRYNIPNAAISLDNGYLQVPEGVYFAGDFTFIAWVNFRTMSDQMRIFVFGNGAANFKCWRVTTEEQLNDAVECAKCFKGLCFIECILDRDDCTKELLEWGTRVAMTNSRQGKN